MSPILLSAVFYFQTRFHNTSMSTAYFFPHQRQKAATFFTFSYTEIIEDKQCRTRNSTEIADAIAADRIEVFLIHEMIGLILQLPHVCVRGAPIFFRLHTFAD